MRRPAPPSLDPARLERIRARVLVTVAASGLAAVGCDHTPEHTINRPMVLHPPVQETANRPPDPPAAAPPDAGALPMGTVNTPFRPPPDAAAPAPVVRPPPPNVPLPLPTANPPPPVMPRMPPGNG